jgi:hypothetical protein
MTDLRGEVIWAAYNRADALTDYTIQNTLGKVREFKKQIILADESLTEDEKSEAIKMLNVDYDYFRVLYNIKETTKICENCQNECLETLYCDYCVQNYLKENFSKWTSGNNDIDNLIQKCQMDMYESEKIVEWIPYNNLQNVKRLTQGGRSKIHTATWIGGRYDKWDSKEKQLKRLGNQSVILKGLGNIEGASRSWFEVVYN